MILRFILSLIIIALIGNTSFCQLVGFGMKTGLNSSFQQRLSKTFDEWSREKNKLGLKVGVFAEIAFTNKFSLQPAFIYNQKGYTGDIWLIRGAEDIIKLASGYKLRLDYLSIDLPLKLKFSERVFAPYLYLGPRIDRIFGYKEKIEPDPRLEGFPMITFQSTYDLYNKWNIGLVAAIGMEYRLTNKIYSFLEIEYNPDLGKAFDNERATIRNNLITINTGIKFKKN